MSSRKLETTYSFSDEPPLEQVNLPESGMNNLSKFEIADRLRTAALSPLDLQSKLMTDMYLSDEERAEFERLSKVGTAPAQGPSPVMEQVGGSGAAMQGAGMSGPSAGPALDLSHAEAPLPARGPFGDTFGIDPALTPEIRPQGLMTSYGLMVPQGLLAPRPFGGAPQQHQPGPAEGHRPEAKQNMFEGMPASQEEVKQHFQPSSGGSLIPSPWQKHGPSPIEDIIKRLFHLIKTMLGFGRPGGYRGGRPELGSG